MVATLRKRTKVASGMPATKPTAIQLELEVAQDAVDAITGTDVANAVEIEARISSPNGGTSNKAYLELDYDELCAPGSFRLAKVRILAPQSLPRTVPTETTVRLRGMKSLWAQDSGEDPRLW